MRKPVKTLSKLRKWTHPLLPKSFFSSHVTCLSCTFLVQPPAFLFIFFFRIFTVVPRWSIFILSLLGVFGLLNLCHLLVLENSQPFFFSIIFSVPFFSLLSYWNTNYWLIHYLDSCRSILFAIFFFSVFDHVLSFHMSAYLHWVMDIVHEKLSW